MSCSGKYSINVPDCTNITVNTPKCGQVTVTTSPKSGGRRRKRYRRRSIKNKKGGSCGTNGYRFDMINPVGDKVPAVVSYNNCPTIKSSEPLSKFDGINLNRNLPVKSKAIKACVQKGGKKYKRNSLKNKKKFKGGKRKKSNKKKRKQRRNQKGKGYNFNLTNTAQISGQPEVVSIPQCEPPKLNATRFTEHPLLQTQTQTQTGGAEFNYIYNPETGKNVSIYGKTGKKVLKNYVKYLNSLKGGSSCNCNCKCNCKCPGTGGKTNCKCINNNCECKCICKK